MDIDTILKTAMGHDASDVHLIAGQPPMVRIHTVMTPLDYPVLTPEGAMRLLEHMAGETQI